MPGPVGVRKAISCLKKKGFVLDNRDHRRYTHFDKQGRKTGAYVYFSRGGTDAKEVGPSLMKMMKSELKLQTIQQVADLLICDMSGADYLAVLAEPLDFFERIGYLQKRIAGRARKAPPAIVYC